MYSTLVAPGSWWPTDRPPAEVGARGPSGPDRDRERDAALGRVDRLRQRFERREVVRLDRFLERVDRRRERVDYRLIAHPSVAAFLDLG